MERTQCCLSAPNLQAKGSSYRVQYRMERLREIKTEFTWTQQEQSDQAEKNRIEREIEW